MDLSNIPLAEGWKWHVWTHGLGISTRWLHNPSLGVYRCTDCGWEATDCRSLSGHNQVHGAVPDEPRRTDTLSGLRLVHHSGARVAD